MQTIADANAIVAQVNTECGISINTGDLVLIDGVWTIDGMGPVEWVEAYLAENEADDVYIAISL